MTVVDDNSLTDERYDGQCQPAHLLIDYYLDYEYFQLLVNIGNVHNPFHYILKWIPVIWRCTRVLVI